MDAAPDTPLAVPRGAAPAARHAEWALALIAALLIAGALAWLDTSSLRGDQNAYNVLVLKKLDPGLLPRDALYRHDPALLHVPWFLDLHAFVARRLGGDVERALVWLAWPIGALYLLGHYALFRTVSGSIVAGALAAVSALTVRNALGGEFWGFDGVRAAATRTILAGLIPLLLLLFVRWREHRSFPAYYLLLGALFNVHPVSAYHLAQVTAVAHVWRARGRPRALIQVVVGMALFAAGALPYVLRFFPARDNVSGAAALATARAALDYRFPYLFYPIAPNAVLSVAFHMALPLAAWLWAARAARGAGPAEATTLARTLVAIAAAAVLLALVGTALIQGLGRALDQPYVDIQQLRTVRLVYPALLAGFALAYARLLARRTRRAYAAVAALVALSLIPPAELIHAFSEDTRDAVKRAVGIRVAEAPARAAAVTTADTRAALFQWARAATPGDALFFTDDFEFRLRTLRSITGSYKDGAFLFLAGSRPFTEWYRLDREVTACRARRGAQCWFPLARRLDADYVVVDAGVEAAVATPEFAKVWERDGWSVWRR